MPDRSDQLAAAVELSFTPGLGRLAQARLWSQFPCLADAFRAGREDLSGMGIEEEAREAMASRRYRPAAEEILDWSIKEGCELLLRDCEHYPELLAEIPDPPCLMYARGDLKLLAEPAVAIVGTRRPTPYGLQVAQGLAADLAERGVVIVSGLARGIDSAAHRGCLESAGKTIAVLGNGIDVVYPRENQRLMARIRESGLLLSEFPPGTCPAPQNFPVRNRVISGLCLGAMVIEAAEYSGSLITARLAMEQNREVFAVPGNITCPRSFGPNFLLKQGAKLVQCWRDVVEELPPEVRQRILARENRSGAAGAELPMLSSDENAVLELLETDRAASFDRIYARAGIAVPQLSNLLLGLEMSGWIRQLPGGLFVKLLRPGNRGTWNSPKA